MDTKFPPGACKQGHVFSRCDNLGGVSQFSCICDIYRRGHQISWGATCMDAPPPRRNGLQPNFRGGNQKWTRIYLKIGNWYVLTFLAVRPLSKCSLKYQANDLLQLKNYQPCQVVQMEWVGISQDYQCAEVNNLRHLVARVLDLGGCKYDRSSSLTYWLGGNKVHNKPVIMTPMVAHSYKSS